LEDNLPRWWYFLLLQKKPRAGEFEKPLVCSKRNNSAGELKNRAGRECFSPPKGVFKKTTAPPIFNGVGPHNEV